MEKDIINQIASNAPFAALFVWLLWDTRKEARENRAESKEREEKLHNTIDENQNIINKNQNIISDLAQKFNVVEDIKDDVDIIKDHLFNKHD